ncbi:MAG: ribose 5-phosphate isomerase B [Armatimonadetes bacterium]|nr:ribose 5-phosphate isomerase B [Armatimonadota bacterium]
MKIALGSDHAGFRLKEDIKEFLQSEGYDFEDFGAFSEDSMDYPDIARSAAEAVAEGKFDRGVLICGTGLGVSITANKVRGIRAALCSDEYTARMSRQHNNANILALGGRVIGVELAREIVRVFLTTGFDAGSRHAKRVAKIER